MSEMQEKRLAAQNTWDGRVVYQVYPLTFKDSNGDGTGDLAGINQQQQYLDNLGIDIIWPSPPYRHGGVDGGYDISNHIDIDPQLGTLDDAVELIATSHEHGRKVILDFVPNHTSDQHEWFMRSCEDPGSEFGDFYIWADPKKLQPGEPSLPHNIVAGGRLEELPEGYTVPNNWSSIFSLPELEKLKEQYGGTIPDSVEVPARTAWAWHPGRQQFYLAEFTKEQPSLNWANPAVRKAQTDVLRFWLDKGVDGFRVDVVNHIGKDPELTDETPVPAGQYDKNQHNPHDQWTQERMVSYWPTLEPYVREMLSTADEYPDKSIRFILEDWATAMAEGMDQDRLSRLRPELATVFNFARLLQTNREGWDAATHKRLLDRYHMSFLTDLGLKGGIPNEVDSSHDVDRVVTRLGRDAARAAALIKLSAPGTPYIYQGEEGGFPNVSDEGTPPHRLKDAEIGLRDGERRPVMWDGSENAGFSKASEESLWLPVDPNYRDLHLADQAKDPRSFYSLYRALISARKHSQELSHGEYNPLVTDHGNVLAFGRPHSNERRQMITIANFSGETTEVAILNANQALARIAISSKYGVIYSKHADIRLDQGRISLEPHEALLLTPAI